MSFPCGGGRAVGAKGEGDAAGFAFQFALRTAVGMEVAAVWPMTEGTGWCLVAVELVVPKCWTSDVLRDGIEVWTRSAYQTSGGCSGGFENRDCL